MLQSEWPEPKASLHIRILAHKETDTHSIDYTADGILAISAKVPTDDASEYVKQSAPIPGYAALNQAGIDALWEVLNEVRLQAS